MRVEADREPVRKPRCTTRPQIEQLKEFSISSSQHLAFDARYKILSYSLQEFLPLRAELLILADDPFNIGVGPIVRSGNACSDFVESLVCRAFDHWLR